MRYCTNMQAFGLPNYQPSKSGNKTLFGGIGASSARTRRRRKCRATPNILNSRLRLWGLVILQPFDLQSCMILFWKGHINICSDLKSQGPSMTQNKVSLMGKYVVLCYKSLVKRTEKVGLFWAQLYISELYTKIKQFCHKCLNLVSVFV